MKRSVCAVALLFVCLYAQAQSLRVGDVRISTLRMDPAVAARQFPLKKGDLFTSQAYETAQEKLHDTRLFKKLEFSAAENNGQMDISIDGEDGYYFFPLAFFSAGDKNVFFASLFEGNYFKKGESAFMTAGVSDDGYAFSGGLKQEDHFFQIGFTKLDTEQRFYKHGWSSTYGVLNVADDEDEYGAPVSRRDMRSYALNAVYARTWEDWTVFLSPELKHVSYSSAADAGNHNQLSVGAAYRHNIRTSSGMGALFGFGISDKQKMLADLPRPRYACAADVSITKGGSWSGADYDITRANLNFLWQAELKKHHIFSLQIKGADSYGSPFSDQVLSTDLLGGPGRYRRLLRGSRGAAVTAAFLYYLLRNDTGLLALQPFYETAFVRDRSLWRDHAGTGATLSYKFWRFPFPLGFNYTHNLSDGSDMTSFVIGGRF